MNQFQYNRVPTQVAPRNGYASPTLGLELTPATVNGRANLTQLAQGVALAGGAAYAILAMASASKKNKTALGVLGGGLAATALLNVVGAFIK
jgi:hypothetical protein